MSYPLLPELLLLGLAFVLATLDAWLWPRRAGRGFAHATFFGLLLALSIALQLWGSRAPGGVPLLVVDAHYEVWRVLLLTLGVLVAALDAARRPRDNGGADGTLLLICLFGGLLAVASRHLLLTYAGLEVAGLAMLARSLRQSRAPWPPLNRWLQAHLLSSSLILLGAALLALQTGDLAYEALRRLDPSPSSSAAAVLLLAGLLLRAAAVPGHGWLPPLARRPGHEWALALAFGTVPAVVVVARLSGDPLMAHMTLLPLLIGAGLASVTVGNLLALAQADLRRLLVYGVIVHNGYALLAIGAGGGSEAHLLHMAVATFAIVGLAAATDFRAEHITGAGLAARRPLLAVAVCVCLLSLAGVPPLPGFAARVRLLTDLATVGDGLFLAGAANTVMTAWIFVAACGRVLFAPPVPQPPAPARPERTAVLVLTALTLVVFGLWPAPLVDMATLAEIVP